MQYQTVFDVTTAIPWGALLFVLPGLLMMAAAGLALLASYGRGPSFLQAWLSKSQQSPAKWKRGFTAAMLGFTILWTAAASGSLLSKWLQYRDALESGNVAVVEGEVEDFDPMPHSGHRDETFSVGGVRFAYSDYRMSTAFNNTRSHGGPIRANLPVRITYLEERDHPILKLEIPATEPVNSDMDPSVERPTVSFFAFGVFWVFLMAVIAWVLKFKKPGRLKKRLFTILIIVGASAFSLFVGDLGAPPLFVAFVAIVTVVNLRTIDFCDRCGSMLVAKTPWRRPEACTSCGAQ